ncbi:hypothetical protein Mag101_07450 [Microbulbifer agarilyticus]|uniref:Uncharacterized protein n=1 Tax=Microbulbifer agarilyticus TaxID=260552 RepID=A0A1Q2M437_9GAMM|nr:hypothetical protein [Microbulbifer agarilyticus]AQQ67493.1 hypothetical protein Mag101_07450 [Microbulbifer agarilyticus]
MFIEFIPTRFAAGVDGKLELSLKAFDPQDKAEGVEKTSLSGIREYTDYRTEEEAKCQTVWVTLTDEQYAVWKSFKNSCAFGQFFTFDPYGTETTPDDPQSVQLKFKSFKEKRRPGRRFQFSFTTIRVIS